MLKLSNTMLKIMSLVLFHVGPGHNPRSISEQIVHFLKWNQLGLWEEEVEEDGVGNVADLHKKWSARSMKG